MNHRSRKWFLGALALALAGVAAFGVYWFRGPSLHSTEDLLKHLPREGAVLLGVDVAALRESGWADKLAANSVPEEPEYRAFVEKTGFDYRTDLDTVLASFHPAGTYFLVRGRFQWETLRAYVKQQGGGCIEALCQMEGSTPDRKISFLPLAPGVMGLAVSRDPAAASHLRDPQPGGPEPTVPPEALWLTVPGSRFHDLGSVPEGTRAFARSFQGAREVRFVVAPANGRLEVRLTVESRSESDAKELASRLRETTDLLRKMIAREKGTPNPADLSGVLTEGRFEQQGSVVRGWWPLDEAFVRNMAGLPSD